MNVPRNSRLGRILAASFALWFTSISAMAVDGVGQEEPADTALALEEGDADAEGGNYRERVQQMQDWLRQRREARENGWAQEVVSPRQRPADSEDEEDNIADDEGGTDYFSRRGLDEYGYRRLDGNVRVRIRGLQGESAHIISIGRHGRASGDERPARETTSSRSKSRPGTVPAGREATQTRQHASSKSSRHTRAGNTGKATAGHRQHAASPSSHDEKTAKTTGPSKSKGGGKRR